MIRLAATVLAGGIALALAVPRVALLLPTVPTADGIAVLAIAAPRTIAPRGAQSILAGLALPGGDVGYSVRVCDEACRTVRQGTLEGPGTWWGRLAQFELVPGHYRMELHLRRPWGRLGMRTVVSHEWEVEVR